MEGSWLGFKIKVRCKGSALVKAVGPRLHFGVHCFKFKTEGGEGRGTLMDLIQFLDNAGLVWPGLAP